MVYGGHAEQRPRAWDFCVDFGSALGLDTGDEQDITHAFTSQRFLPGGKRSLSSPVREKKSKVVAHLVFFFRAGTGEVAPFSSETRGKTKKSRD